MKDWRKGGYSNIDIEGNQNRRWKVTVNSGLSSIFLRPVALINRSNIYVNQIVFKVGNQFGHVSQVGNYVGDILDVQYTLDRPKLGCLTV